jgi:uncharacterized protein involved in outer membrane biogenesis
MPRWAKWLVVGIATTVALLGGTAWLVLSAISPDRLVAVAAAQTKATTGRDLVIGGRVDGRVFPAPAVIAEDIRFGNAGWGSRPDMIRVRHAEGHVAFWSHWSTAGSRSVGSWLVGSDVLLETEADGTGNWLFRREGEPVTGAEPMPEIVLDVLRIEDAQIAYRDGKSGHETRLAIERLTVDGQDDTERIDLAANLRGQRFSVKGSTGRLESLFASAVALPVDLALATDGASAVVKGTLGTGKQAGQLDLAVEADVADAAGLSRLVGTDLPLPLPLKLSANALHSGSENVVDPF